MHTLKFQSILLLFSVILNGCGLLANEEKPKIPNTLFGTWALEEIRYDNGETLLPANSEPYWVEFSKDSIMAEGAYHPSLVGRSNCNPCFGYFDYDNDSKSIKIAFICERLVCGIATEFASAVATSYEYSFSNGNLTLFFKTAIEGKGQIILNPKH